MNNTIKLSVDEKYNGKRLDIFLSNSIDQFTRSFLKKLIQNRHVKVNNKIHVSPSIKIKYQDEVIINVNEKKIQYCSKKN